MSRECLCNFLTAVERSSSIRRKAKNCQDNASFLALASEYGFNVTLQDLQGFEKAEKIETWFKQSEIHPIKR